MDQLTLSIGFSKMSPYDFPISVIEHADKALYHAKNNGRNQCVYFGDILQEHEKDMPSTDNVELF